MIRSTYTLGLLTAIAVNAIVTLTPAAAASGCGPARYRGPDGACHRFGYDPHSSGYNGPYRSPFRWNDPIRSAPPVSQSVNQSVGQTISQIVNQSVSQSISQSVPSD